MLDLALDLFLSIVLPAALTSAVVIGVASFASRITVGKWKFGWKAMEVAVTVAVIAGLLVGNLRRQSAPYLPGDFGWEWMLACAVAAMVVELIKSLAGDIPIRARVALVVVPIFIFAWVLMPTEWRNGMTLWAFAIVIALNAIAFAAARPSHPAVAIIAACAILGGASLVLVCAAFAKLSDVAVLMSAAVAGLLVASTRPMPLRQVSLMIGVAVPALMLNGYNQSFSEVPLFSYLLVALSPMFFFIGRIPSLRRGPQWKRTALEVALPLIAVGIGVALAISAEGLGLGDWEHEGDWEEVEPNEKTPEPTVKPEPEGPEPVG